MLTVFSGALRAAISGGLFTPRCAPLRALAWGYRCFALRVMSLRDGIPLPCGYDLYRIMQSLGKFSVVSTVEERFCLLLIICHVFWVFLHGFLTVIEMGTKCNVLFQFILILFYLHGNMFSPRIFFDLLYKQEVSLPYIQEFP